MKERLKQAIEVTSASPDGEDPSKDAARQEQERVDRILNSLFFSGPNKLLSEGIEFDANLR